MNKKIALIFGSAGQDGSLMTLYLLKNGYKIYALSQSKKFINLKSNIIYYSLLCYKSYILYTIHILYIIY